MKFINNSLLAFYLMCMSLTHFSLTQNSPQDYVDAHNAFGLQSGQSNHLEQHCCSLCSKYADERKRDCQMDHSMGPYGENLAEGYGQMDGVDVVKFWASKKPQYDYNLNSCVGDECLHYTQIVWSTSVHVGCGRVKCENGWLFVICSYDPPGNIEGQRPYQKKIH